MNNNNNNRGNNRRRGRTNNGMGGGNSGGGGVRPQGGGQQVNRIDSRARGNAPQMLEKYRKLAQDAHLNGDRVAAEYNLQFADHYFRVIADTRVRQEEARARRDDRWGEGESGGEGAPADDHGDFAVDNDFMAFDQPPVYTRREREVPAPTRDERPRDERPREDSPREDRPREDRAPRYTPPVSDEAAVPVDQSGTDAGDGDARNVYEPIENPFLRDNRGGRGLRPRREDRRPPHVASGDAPQRNDGEPADAPQSGGDDDRGDNDRGDNPRGDDDRGSRGRSGRLPPRRTQQERGDRVAPVSSGLDPSFLPPSISAGRRTEEPEAAPAIDADDAPAARPRRARRKPGGDSGETLESVG